ncbi:MAG: pyrroloquinoline quinone-dependent dehydrogenase [Acidobacteria bacterium]|nr:MAG: pyrroloquinoline quinone-dependent dehydrogenase [Acidobacteriota bacterium]
MPRRTARFVLLLVAALALIVVAPAAAQLGAPNGEWPTYGGDLGHTRYSALDQIDADNFSDLEVAWRFKTESLGPRPEFVFQSTPLMVDGVLYTTAGTRRAAVAIDAETGELLWIHRLNEGERGAGAPRRLSGRGLTYWDDGAEGQIFYVTPGYRLIALNARTGDRIADFGEDGMVDLKLGLDQDLDLVTADIGLHAAPIIANGVIMIGAAHLPGVAPRAKENVTGHIRGYDARTGERKWIFHTIPGADEFGNDTWLNDSWRYTGNTGVWGQMTIDEELGYVYLPVEMPTGDLYGGHRLGDNLFADSIVAIEIATGNRVWHYQAIHHDVWDFDLPNAPILVDITVDGRPIKALAQPSKQAFLYVLDRATGAPVWPIEERPVPPSDVPGEVTSPTQPFPTKPPPYDRQGISVDDLIDFTPDLRRRAEAVIAPYRVGPLYTPPSVASFEGTLGTLHIPALTGGSNWPGGSFDPETGIFYIYSKTQVSNMGLISSPERSNMDFIMGRPRPPAGAGGGRGGRGGRGGFGGLSVEGIPIVKPPWGRITAIDLNAGEIVWQVAHGETPDNIRNHPLLEGVDVPRTGAANQRIGTLVTKTLVIASDGGMFTNAEGERGSALRAYDKATGVEVGTVALPVPATGSPMTYMLGDTQYLVVAIAAGGFAGELWAFKAPE